MKDLRQSVLKASGYHCPKRGEIDILKDVLLEIDDSGVITAVHQPEDSGYPSILNAARAGSRLSELPAGTWLIPGLVDLHVHAPQYPQLGLALDEPLEIWLNRYTFPMEARYADPDFARDRYRTLVEDLMANGTTTAAYFATIHEEATCILVDTCLEKGQRAVIGKVAMDNPDQCPDYYRDATAQDSLQGSRNIIDYIRSHPDNGPGMVQPAVTPRFIPSCSDETLEGLGRLAAETGAHVLTHCSESDWEHGYVLERHGMTDTESLDRFGLLGRRSILAHSVFLEPENMETIRNRQSAVAHCPLSNSYFGNAVFPLRAALEKGLHVGLGTDISGGPNASIFSEMRTAVSMSRLLESGTDPSRPPEERGAGREARIDFRDAFFMATAGGGIALDMPIGRLAPGCRFDAVAIDTRTAEGSIRIDEDRDEPEEILQKIIYTASRPNIARVWTDGILRNG